MEKNDDTTPEASEPSPEEQAQEQSPADEQEQANGTAAARGAWMAIGVTFFSVGVTFTVVMRDNIALGITFFALGVVFFSLAASKKTP